MPSAIAAVILLVFPLLVALLNGDLGPGIFKNAETGWKYRFRKAISQPSVKEDAMFMSDKEGALRGHDLSFFRFTVTQLEEMRGEVAMIRGGAAAELMSLTGASLDTAPPKAASKGGASGDVAAVLATMLGPVLQELRDVKRLNAELADMQQMLALMQHTLDALHKQQHPQEGGGGAGCFGCGAKPAVSQGGAEPPAWASSRKEKLLDHQDTVAVDVSAHASN